MARPVTRRKVATLRTIAAIVLSSFIAFWLVRGSQSLANSNITRTQYQNALSKWNNLHVTEYEATVKVSTWGKWKIVVHIDNAYGSQFVESVQASYSHRIIHFEWLESNAFTLGVSDVQFETVGGLFDRIDEQLYCQEHSCEHQDFYLPSHYIVEFDQTMGYPRSITSINDYATVETRIENLKVLKQSDK